MSKTKQVSREIHEKTYGEERDKQLETTTAEIEKRFGKGSIMKYGDSGPDLEVEAIPTGALSLDVALGIGGVPRGRIIEIYGPESSGKTTLSLEILAEAQALGGVVAFIDAEHALDPNYAARIGVDIDEVLSRQAGIEAAIAEEGYEDFLFVITDILNSNSKGLYIGDAAQSIEAAFNQKLDNNVIDLPGVVSRKKQVVPPLENQL